jgi:hypothetical protein
VCGTFGIVEEQLIKIPHAVKQQHVGVLCLDAQILLHHGRVRGQVFFAHQKQSLILILSGPGVALELTLE